MVAYNEIYSEGFENANLAASATETFAATQVNRDRYGSSNSLIITSRDDNQINVILDNKAVPFAILQPNGSLIIKPEDGIYFDNVTLENLGADQVDANKVSIRIAMAVMVNG